MDRSGSEHTKTSGCKKAKRQEKVFRMKKPVSGTLILATEIIDRYDF